MFERRWTIAEEMKKIIFTLVILILVGCQPKSLLPSLKNGTGEFISCFYDSSSRYKDTVFEVSFNKNSNTSNVFFIKPEKKLSSKVITHTNNRLSLELMNDKGESFLITFYFDTSKFVINSTNYEDSGTCEEKVK